MDVHLRSLVQVNFLWIIHCSLFVLLVLIATCCELDFGDVSFMHSKFASEDNMSGLVTRFCYPENMFIPNHSMPISLLVTSENGIKTTCLYQIILVLYPLCHAIVFIVVFYPSLCFQVHDSNFSSPTLELSKKEKKNR